MIQLTLDMSVWHVLVRWYKTRRLLLIERPFQAISRCMDVLCCWMDQDGTWHGGRPRSRPHCVTWAPSSPAPKKGHSPQLSARVYCGQTAVCIRIPLDTEVGLSLGDIVLDGDPAPSRKKGHSPTQFLAHISIVAMVAQLSYC